MTKRRVHRELVVQPQDQSIRYIALTKGQIAIVDASDYEFLEQWHWNAHWSKTSKSFYAVRPHNGPPMPNVILGLERGILVDHENHNTLDNRRKNLKEATKGQNMMNRRVFSNNTSGVSGVCWHSRDKKWAVYINVDRKRIQIGTFPADQKEQAIAARKAAQQEHHGEFAYAHHPSG